MNKTIKQIAEELKIDKQKVYRFIKSENINEVYRSTSEANQEANQGNSTKYYDDVAQERIKKHFENIGEANQSTSETNQSASSETHQSDSEAHRSTSNELVLQILKEQLEAKDKQIAELNERLKETTLLLGNQEAKNNELIQRLLLIEEKSKDENEIVQGSQETETNEKKSWWTKIFK